MSWVAIGGAAISVVGGYLAKDAANDGAQQGADAMTQAQMQMYNQTRSDLQPYMQFGQQAIGGLGALNAGDYSGFFNSPDYLAAMQAGTDNLDKSAAARGQLFSGAQTKDLAQFNQGLASQYLGNYRNSLFGQAQMGQNAAAGVGGFGQNAANQSGSAQQSAYNQMGQNNAGFYGGLANTIGGAYGNIMGNR